MLFKRIKKSQFDLIPILVSLIFFFFLVIFSLIFYFNYWIDKIEKHRNFVKKINYFSLGEQVVSLPELNCGELENAFSCFDLYKIRYFQDLLINDFFSRNLEARLFKNGQKRIIIKVIFDKNSNFICKDADLDNLLYNHYGFRSISCSYYVLYNVTKGNFKEFKEKNIIKFPLLVRMRSNDGFDYFLALLEIISYY